MSAPLLVLADTYQEAYRYAREAQLGSEGRDWRYITRVDQILGRSGGRFVDLTRGTSALVQLDEFSRIRLHLRISGAEEVAP